MANRVFLKKRESHAQQDVWAAIKRNLQWKRPLVLLVIHNPWKHHLVPKATSRFCNPNTFYCLSQCLARPRFGIMDLAPTLSDTTGDVWLLGCCFFEATRRHSPLAILWLQGIHHQTDRWIPCSKLRVSYPARVTRRWCVKMPLRNNKHIGNLVIEISSSSSSSSSSKKIIIMMWSLKPTKQPSFYWDIKNDIMNGIWDHHWPPHFGTNFLAKVAFATHHSSAKKRLPKFGKLGATENHPKVPCSFFSKPAINSSQRKSFESRSYDFPIEGKCLGTFHYGKFEKPAFHQT